MMKNAKIIIGIIAVVVVVIVAICIIINNTKKNNDEESAEIANSINNNSNLPIEYMSKYDSTDTKLQKYERIDNYMSEDFEDNDISFSYYGYPNDESEYYLGKISLKTNKYNILGVTVGDDLTESISKIEQYGFKIEERDSTMPSFRYGDFTIILNLDTNNTNEDGNIIETIEVEVSSEYLGNKIY